MSKSRFKIRRNYWKLSPKRNFKEHLILSNQRRHVVRRQTSRVASLVSRPDPYALIRARKYMLVFVELARIAATIDRAMFGTAPFQ